ncbi:NEW3 domain-containing protein [Brevibacillus porteri]|uniref:Alpha-galactosidase NEW3 domain-containing protein n=1 Tax=Brevibacillus porteri TaxID=2126350 RepID=A0ABX5FRZ9_9BACL|nr:NEW3 domain-containing protein [Brevibacillus porteri]MED1797987.1 NEW3 domain-containing protein [Brevibacillus porteri]MED2132178.1 NEW3 domain-containing protein [Brevibacillus porteri]MED2742741.1 NEW3 domain-containing protein [Brevibacillus porteri]MED2814217.1 NEW3 domain-containing protein [Brevibacillus porteri]MED2893778.1 NEW3 domain-containing protein [Brevibacillus porteri]
MSKGKLAKLYTITTAAVLATSLIMPVAPETAHADRGVVDLWKAIKPLTTIASAMNTGAHPDDEHSSMLAYLSLGKGVDTSSVIANRGEGGQNEIGSELGNALGIIRTRELQEASKITNIHLENLSEKIDDPIFDFGFSKSPDETLQKWGEDVAYEKLIRRIRTLRPDVVIPAFLNEPSTHGHHRAINVITVRAFKDAADPNVFPQHAKEGLAPWQVKKLYLPAKEKDYSVKVPVGDYDEIYGASYVQLGEESRFMHKSQGMGRHYDEGPSFNYYKLDQSIVETKDKEADFFTGIAYSFDDLAKEVARQSGGEKVAGELKKLQKDAAEVIAAYPSFASVAKEAHEMLADVEKATAVVEASSLPTDTKTDLRHRLGVKKSQLNKASAEALSLVTKVKPETTELVAGQTTKVTVTAYNGGQAKVGKINLALNVPKGWQAKPQSPTSFSSLGYNQTVKTTFDVTVPSDAALFQPYAAFAITADVSYSFAGSTAISHVTPADAIAVLPSFSMVLSPNATVLNTQKPEEPIPVKVTVKNYNPGAAKTTITLDVPKGWSVEPQAAPLAFEAKGETKSVAFTVKADASVQPNKYTVTAVASGNGKESRHGAQVIRYPHIGTTYFVQPATLAIQAFDLKVPEGLKVGYVSSGFDNIDQYLSQLGVNVTNLSAKDIESGDLDQYDTIVLGIRAYGFRPELIPSNARLLKYVENGGNLVVQYHKPEDKWKPELAPYPIKIGAPLIQWRVTDEKSKVTVLAPDHALFHSPNKITEEDWDNWIQDRSAYNPSEWGKEYTELISNGDEGEKEFTGTYLTAKYGKGTYTYSSLVWYREIPSLVPGAIRLFVNMISPQQ